MGDVVDLMGNATEAIRQSNRAHRQACGFAHFTGLHHDPAIVRQVLNDAMPNELCGKSVGGIPDHLIAYVLRRVSIERARYDQLNRAAEHDAAVALSLDLEQEITRRLTHR